MSITPISGSEPSDFQTHDFNWLEGQYSEIDFIPFTDTALKSTSALGCGGESWLLGLSSTSLNVSGSSSMCHGLTRCII